MKRVIVACRTGDSGLTDYSLSLIPHLAPRAEVEFVTAAPALSHPARRNAAVVPLFRRFRHVAVDMLRFAAYALRHRPDVILFQSWIAWPLLDALVVRFLRWRGIGVAITVHDVMPHHPMPWSRWSVGVLFRSFDKLVAHSAAARQSLVELGVRGEILEVPHGEYDIFDIDKLDRQTARARLGGIVDGECVVLFFGHLDERKGLVEFLSVARRLAGQGFRFIVAGKNDLGPRYRSVLEENYPPCVRIDAGRVPFERVQEYFAASDVVALPYREGTTSGVAKVAMAFGKPIIASRIGDLPETLQEWPGILIDPADLESGLEAALRRIRDTAGSASDQAQSARARFRWDHIGAAYARHLGLINEAPGSLAPLPDGAGG